MTGAGGDDLGQRIRRWGSITLSFLAELPGLLVPAAGVCLSAYVLLRLLS